MPDDSMNDLFSASGDGNSAASPAQPLADRMRPVTLDDFCGQQHLLTEGKPLRRVM